MKRRFNTHRLSATVEDRLFCTSTVFIPDPLSNPFLQPASSLASDNQAWLRTGPDPRVLDIRGRHFGLAKDFRAARFNYEGPEVWDLHRKKPPPTRSSSVPTSSSSSVAWRDWSQWDVYVDKERIKDGSLPLPRPNSFIRAARTGERIPSAVKGVQLQLMSISTTATPSSSPTPSACSPDILTPTKPRSSRTEPINPALLESLEQSSHPVPLLDPPPIATSSTSSAQLRPYQPLTPAAFDNLSPEDRFRTILAQTPLPPLPRPLPRQKSKGKETKYLAAMRRSKPARLPKRLDIQPPPKTAVLSDLEYVLPPPSVVHPADGPPSNHPLLVESTIEQLCLADKTTEAVRLFQTTYPASGPSPTASSLPTTPEPPLDLYLYLVNAFIRNFQIPQAQQWLRVVMSKARSADHSPSTYLTLFRLFVWSKDHAAAHDLFTRLHASSSKPMEDDTFAREVFRSLMRAGPAEKDSSISWYWMEEMKAYGLSPGLGEWDVLMRAHLYANEFEHVQAVWELAGKESGVTEGSDGKDRAAYTRLFTTFLEANRLAGVGWEEIKRLGAEVVKHGVVLPDSFTYLALMRAACEGGAVDDARGILSLMEHKTKIAPDSRHYGALITGLLALDRTSSDKTALALSQEILSVVTEVKARNLHLEYPVYAHIIRYLSSHPSTQPKAIELCHRLIDTLPGPGETWSTSNQWAKRWAINAVDPSTEIFLELVRAYAAQSQSALGLEMYHRLRDTKDWDVSLKATEVLLGALPGHVEIKELESLWRSAVTLAQEQLKTRSTSDTKRLRKRLDNEPIPAHAFSSLPLMTERDLFDPVSHSTPTPTPTRTPIPIPTAFTPPSPLLSKPLTLYIRGLLASPGRSATYDLKYMTEQCIGISKLGFGLDSIGWSFLALAYLEADRVDEAFFLMNDIILFKHEDVRRQYESWTGRTLENKPVSPSRALANHRLHRLRKEDSLSDQMERHNPEFQHLVRLSYRMFSPDRILRKIHHATVLDPSRPPPPPSSSDRTPLHYLTERDLPVDEDGSSTVSGSTYLTERSFDPDRRMKASALWLPHKALLSALANVVHTLERRSANPARSTVQPNLHPNPAERIRELRTRYRRAWRFVTLWRERHPVDSR